LGRKVTGLTSERLHDSGTARYIRPRPSPHTGCSHPEYAWPIIHEAFSSCLP
jgi:hypothetical protein